MKRFLFIPVFILLTANYAVSADLTLDEAVEDALKNNPDILVAKDKLKQAELKLKEAKRIFTPNISVHSGYNVITDKEGIGFVISQDLDQLLGGNKKEKDNATLELDIAKKELFLTEQKVIKEVTDAYYALKLHKSILKLKEKILESRKKSLEFAEARFDLGKISLDSLLSSQKELAEANVELEKAECELKEAELTLSQLIGEAR